MKRLLTGTIEIHEWIAKGLSSLLGQTPEYWLALEEGFWQEKLPDGHPPWNKGRRIRKT
jgi:plasmid maintenance system antidote protein VapI